MSGIEPTYFRSSSLGQWAVCPHSYSLQYQFGLSSFSGKKACMGTIVHRVMQILGDRQKAAQDNQNGFQDDDFGWLTIEQCDDIEFINKLCFEYYQKIETHLDLEPDDQRKCLQWCHKALSYKEGFMDPRNMHVVQTEKFFDFEIKKPKFHYSHTIGGKKFKGHLSLKGTVDLITQVDPNVLEVIDYKTGKRSDYATGKEKTYKKLMKDPQLLLYNYALKREYPDKHLIFTIFYINDGGPFSMPYDDEEIQLTEDMLLEKFQEIQKTKLPKLLDTRARDWRCKYVCHFHKNKWPGTNKSICHFIRDKVKKQGLKSAIEEFGNIDKIGTYGDGGGRKDIK